MAQFASVGMWASLLSSGSVFLHDKRPVADQLARTLADAAHIKVRRAAFSELDVDASVAELTVGPARRVPQALLVHAGSDIAEMLPLLACYRKAGRRRDGLWVQGYFEGTEQMTKLRSVIALTESQRREIEQWAESSNAVGVAVTIEPSPKRVFPVLVPNPAVLVLDAALGLNTVYKN